MLNGGNHAQQRHSSRAHRKRRGNGSVGRGRVLSTETFKPQHGIELYQQHNELYASIITE